MNKGEGVTATTGSQKDWHSHPPAHGKYTCSPLGGGGSAILHHPPEAEPRMLPPAGFLNHFWHPGTLCHDKESVTEP